MFQWNYDKKTCIFAHENVFESFICKLFAILFMPQSIIVSTDKKSENTHVVNRCHCVLAIVTNAMNY